MQSKHWICIAVIGIILFLLPSLAVDAANTVAVNGSSNSSSVNTAATWTEYDNVSLSTGTGNVTIYLTASGKVNYSAAMMYGRIKRDSAVIESFNLTSSTYPQTVTYVTPYAETAGTHYYTFESYCTAGRLCTIYNRTLSVQYLATGEYLTSSFNSTYDSAISALQGNDTIINTSILGVQNNDTTHDSKIAGLQGNDTLINASILGVQNNDTTQDAKDIALGNNDTTLSNKDTTLGNNDTTHVSWITGLQGNDTLINTSILGTQNNDTTFNGWLNQGVKNTDNPTFVTVNANVSASNATITTVNITNLHGDANGNVNASGTNFTNATNLQIESDYIVYPCLYGLLTCEKNGSTWELINVNTNKAAVIQRALDDANNSYVPGSKKRVKLIGDVYVLTSPIYIKNGTIFDYSGKLQIVNGTPLGTGGWDGNVGLVNVLESSDVELGGGFTIDVNYNITVQHALMAKNVTNFTFRDYTVRNTNGSWLTKLERMSKGSILSTNYYSQQHFPSGVFEDGLHVVDSNNITIDGVKGNTNDDLVTIEARHTNVSDITILNVVGSSPCCSIVKLMANWRNLSAGTPLWVQDILIDNVDGYNIGASGLMLNGDFQALENSTYSRITARNLNFHDWNKTASWACSQGVSFNCDSATNNGNGTRFNDISIQAKIYDPSREAVKIRSSNISKLSLDIEANITGNYNGIDAAYESGKENVIKELYISPNTNINVVGTYQPITVVADDEGRASVPSDNILKNADMESWGASTHRPDAWTGSDFYTNKSSLAKSGLVSANTTSTGSTQFLSQRIADIKYAGKTLTFGLWVNSSNAGASNLGARVEDFLTVDNAGTSESGSITSHPNDGKWHYLVASKQIRSNAVQVAATVRVPATGLSVYSDSASLVQGIAMPSFQGSVPLIDDGYSVQINSSTNNVTIPILTTGNLSAIPDCRYAYNITYNVCGNITSHTLNWYYSGQWWNSSTGANP